MNIFENAKFGDKFRMRNGDMAIYWTRSLSYHHLLIKEGLGEWEEDGTYHPIVLVKMSELDIIGKWQD